MDEQEAELMAKIQEYRDMGEDAWRSTETCSDFAAAGWEAATGEDLSSWWWTTHSELKYAFLFRAYRADQGKWQTADPLGYPDGWNNFTYCENHASWEIDFMGLISDDYAGNALKIWENLCSAPQTTPYLYEIRNGYYNALTKRNPFDTVINAVETVNNNIDSVNKILSYNPYGVLPDN